MSSYEFQSMLYPTHRHMLNAIAHEWVTAGGSNSDEWVRGYMAANSDEQIAAECIEQWGLGVVDEPMAWEGDDEAKSHMTEHGYDADDLALAIGRLR